MNSSCIHFCFLPRGHVRCSDLAAMNLPSQQQDDPVLRLQLADDAPDTPLEASTRLLHACSTCAFGLRRDSSTWDLSNLLIDGHPVSRDTVTAWLNVVYMHQDDVAYGDATSPAAASATQLYQLLSFADAVGSSRGVVKACLAGLEQLAFEVKVGDKEVQLAADSCHSWVCTGGQWWDLRRHGWKSLRMEIHQEQKVCVGQQVAGQLEPLLYLAYRLQLAPLKEVLHGFIQYNVSVDEGVLVGHVAPLLSARIIREALDAGVAKEALLQLVTGVGRPLFCSTHGHFVRVDGPSEEFLIKLRAVVVQPLPTARAGTLVTVELDLNRNELTVDGMRYPVQILTGPCLNNPHGKRRVLGEAALPPVS